MAYKCPNDPNHKRFEGEGWVKERWIFDEEGDCIDTMEHETGTSFGPGIDGDGPVFCTECGARAKDGDA